MTALALGTDTANPPAAPDHLGERGRELWVDVLSRYSLRVDELLLLEQAAGLADDIARLRSVLAGADLVVLGHAKQPVSHPLLAELRQLRATLATHLRQLGLPDEAAAGGVEAKSPRHVRAAETRWSQHRAAQAAEQARAEQTS